MTSKESFKCCLNCNMRFPGCNTNCESYKNVKQIRDMEKQKKQEYNKNKYARRFVDY